MTTKGRLLFGGLGALAYAVLSHLLMVHAADAPWAVAALVGPALFMLTGMALQKRNRAGLWLCGAAWAAVAAVAVAGGVGDVNRLYLVQHAGIHLGLGVSFAATLRHRLSMIGEIAERVHGTLPSVMVRYTRSVTLVWCGYFFLMAAASCWVYAVRPWQEWSLLANVVTPVTLALLFVGEYLLRYKLHPEFERATLADAWRAYQQPLTGRRQVQS